MTARQWVQYSFSVDVSDPSETPVQMLSYDPDLSRVRINLAATLAGGAPPPGSTWKVERSTDLVRWATVRGGTSIPIPES